MVGGIGICVELSTLAVGANLYSSAEEAWAASALGASLL